MARFDPAVFDVGRTLVRIRTRVRVQDGTAHDVVLENGTARMESAPDTPCAILSADPNTYVDRDRGGSARRHGRVSPGPLTA